MKQPKKALDDLMYDCRAKLHPLSGYFELTPRCSLDCKMCYVHLTDRQMKESGSRELSTAQWIKLIDEAYEAGMLFAILTGGECLMHKGFKEIYLHMKEKGLLITLNTNATLLNDEYINFFRKNPPNLVKVSLYGITEDGYENVTGHRLYHVVKENILKLKAAGLNLQISVTVSRQLYTEATEIVRFALDNHIPYIIDMAMYDAEQETGRSRDEYDLSADEIASKYLEIRALENKPLFHNGTIPAIPERVTDGTVARSLRCSAGRSSFTIKWTGIMQPCIMELDDCPNAVEIGFKAAWERVTQISKDFVIPVECIDCKMQKVCSQCVFLRLNPNDFGHANPETCKVTVAKIRNGIVKVPQDG